MGGGMTCLKHFQEHVHVQIWFREKVICHDIKRFEQISSESGLSGSDSGTIPKILSSITFNVTFSLCGHSWI